ncbi:ubiquitin-binding protein cue5 [Purpureocillium takamizusanense]|uniref:Ubiquitin-binding protein cue5 n=1 Tax=Purpureocillium takamizusanense TaxID=2060973 RepID=A0A9Q8QJK4_9HYPO|nr:ubiquitin-binding protein cue5 [Purpureocillium takamizusanense]UNI20366.1 ubiquitin-binding protein cue5 [Purpureocillium takamizusanense]
MSSQADANKPATEAGAESPTTARPLEMDDDDVQDTGVVASDDAPGTGSGADPKVTTTATTTPLPAAVTDVPEAASDEAPPPKPPRPLTEAQKNEMILKEAFPSVDNSVIKAVLRASSGRVEPAFNALLEMTDPDAAKNEPEDAPPPQPRRPQGHTPMSQVEADELYARQLAEHYDNVGAYEARTSNRSRGAQHPFDDDDREHSFIDDDLPVIRENLRKGFLETQTKVNGWITNLRKKIEDGFDETEEPTQRQGSPFRRPGEASRRSGDYDRYDADPQVLSDDFAGMKFSADGTPANRTNPTLHRPPPPSSSPRPSDGRRVGFKEETEEINMYDTSPRVPPKDTPSSAMKPSKWQPLSTVEPAPMADNDPFSLGDSEDEKDAKDVKEKPKDSKTDESERLKKAAAEAMADSLVDPTKEGDAAGKKS